MSTDRIGDATYDPDDNKLRLRAFARLSREDFDRAKAAGFRWAPRQELFFAHWSPAAEDLLTEWCGEIEDEDTTLAERAADRAERFGGYSANREREGDQAERAVRELADNIPLGQPILVGHHSEKRARKDAERIENGMRRAVKAWRTAEYWQQRARGVIASANYKDRPEVRARRIKKLEAERRRRVASYTPHGPAFTAQPSRYGPGSCIDAHDYGTTCEMCEPQPMVMVGNKGRGAWPARVVDLEGIERSQARWIAHLDRRLDYERALLAEQGAEKLLEKPKRPKLPPLLNYRAPDGIEVRNQWNGESERMGQVEMTKAEWAKVWNDYKGTRLAADGSHRVRTAITNHGGRRGLSLVFITDSKAHPAPEVTT